ncbi:uncharacterized protein LOC122653038 [Telopea speciosissima]|uniref:uncharacterized protein LOC122653038 n=1 Tax=Telopea speciosissima TaxID=54955 RepID=UPI001CC46FEC|nr:uncharacterized protein LOC122653038 [Telopea speciosissima]
MAEVESPSGSVRMGLLINDVTTAETLKRRQLEDDHTGGGSLKYKRRNVDVKRDFPKDCGRFSERMNEFSKEGDGNSKVGEESGTIVELEPDEVSGFFGGCQALESLNDSVEAESETWKILKW